MIQRLLLRQSRAFSSRSSSVLRTSKPTSPPFRRLPTQSSRHITASQSYSTTAEASNGTAGEASAAQENQSETNTKPIEADPRDKELEAKNKEVIDLKVRTPPQHHTSKIAISKLTNVQDKYLRSVAEFRNLQERTKRDVQAANQFAIQRFAKDLVDSVDNLDRALTTVPSEKVTGEDSNKDLVSLYEGLKMTERILMQTLKKHGLERFDPSENGEKFDPNLHEATFMTPMEGKEDGTAFHTQQKGFMLNGRVLRVRLRI